MQHIVRTSALLGAACLVLAACASQVGTGTAMRSGSRYQLDDEYMSTVERRAALAGVRVHWVNPPMKEVDETTSATSEQPPTKS